MKLTRHFLLLLLLLSLTLFTSACGDDDTNSDTSSDASGDASSGGGDGSTTVDAEALYQNTCALSSCHGPDGDSGTALPKLTEVIPTASDVALREVLVNGSGSMPGLQYNDDELDAMMIYLRERFQ